MTYCILDVKFHVVESDLADAGVALVDGELGGGEQQSYLPHALNYELIIASLSFSK